MSIPSSSATSSRKSHHPPNACCINSIRKTLHSSESGRFLTSMRLCFWASREPLLFTVFPPDPGSSKRTHHLANKGITCEQRQTAVRKVMPHSELFLAWIRILSHSAPRLARWQAPFISGNQPKRCSLTGPGGSPQTPDKGRLC